MSLPTLYKNIDVDESEDEVVAGPVTVQWLVVTNLGTAKRYLKFYDALAADVVVGTTVPDLTFPVPAQADGNGGGFLLPIPSGMHFATACTVAATTGIADNDTGAPSANEVVINLGYIN